MRRRDLPGLLAMAILLAVAGGCSSGQNAASYDGPLESLTPELAAVPVRQIITSEIAGSAVHVGDNLLLTCRHLLTGPVLEIDRSLTRYEVVVSGSGGKAFVEDWALIRLLDVDIGRPRVAVPVDLGEPLKRGDEVMLIGFWARDMRTRGEIRTIDRVLVRGTVRSQPMFHRKELVYFDAPFHNTYEGISGGAALRRDPHDGSLRLVGIYTGTYANILFGHGFWMTHVARPVPPEAAAYID